ncbi:putative low molecular weight phosphotyrosine protein phosphatase isoform X1 [Apostichopus japonicus]|uniref:protein-tyrosine-phosphatase n=1 Tax=Stichopus japonicus TaxID=307972 RepID=A0A2G8JP39_STIJA|nr:putative low molecular weight phosphotyrosine protein phosphatase isoform X1 [Apostichopus japonicus]
MLHGVQRGPTSTLTTSQATKSTTGGNICRSVMAESILKHMVAEKGQEKEWIIDSAATSDYEIGSTPDSRTNLTLKGNNLPESDHIARQASWTNIT